MGTRNNTHNTIQHTLLKCLVVGTRNNTHNTYIQQHILLKCVVVGTRNNTHNTTQQHTLLMLLLCVTYDDVGVVSSTHSLHPHHFVVVVCHLWWCGCCFEYPQFTPTSRCCCCVSPMMMWVLFRVPTVYTHITLTTHFFKMCCCGYSKQHPQHHTTTHFVKMFCCGYSKQHPQHHTTTYFVKMSCCGYSKQHPQHHTTTHFVNVVVVCHLWWYGCCFEYPQFTPTSLCCCCVSPMMMWVLCRVPTVYTHITLTTHFVEMCCGYSKQHPQHHTTTHLVKMCCFGYSKQVDPQHHTTTHLVNVVVVCHLWTIVVSRILCIQITRPHLAFGRYSSLLTGTSLAV